MQTVIYAALGYLILLLVVRVLTRRPGAQMTMFEFVIVFLIGGIIILSTVDSDRSVTNCVCAILTIGMMHRVVSWGKSYSPRIGALVDGTPVVLLKNGEWQKEVMRKVSLDPEDIMAAARTKGVNSIFDLKYAILERNGSISIIRNQQA